MGTKTSHKAANAKKTKQLGMPVGTATNRLRKLIMFSLIQELGRDDCFRCGWQIGEASELSIEHKVAWLDNDVDLFWDLDNISFSHLKCNVGAGRRKRADHGTSRRYRSGCRCPDCFTAKQTEKREYLDRKKDRP